MSRPIRASAGCGVRGPGQAGNSTRSAGRLSDDTQFGQGSIQPFHRHNRKPRRWAASPFPHPRAKKHRHAAMLRPVPAEVLSETSRIRRCWWSVFARELAVLMPRRAAFASDPSSLTGAVAKGIQTEFPPKADVSLTTPQARGPTLTAWRSSKPRNRIPATAIRWVAITKSRHVGHFDQTAFPAPQSDAIAPNHRRAERRPRAPGSRPEERVGDPHRMRMESRRFAHDFGTSLPYAEHTSTSNRRQHTVHATACTAPSCIAAAMADSQRALAPAV